ncbi:MAG: VOC family protein [Halobacteriovoraceae bacterium]|nr:VOC family protein [Halobacteriovoraceae bacterium]
MKEKIATFPDFIAYAKLFLGTTLEKIKLQNLDLKNWEIDHLCYRVENLDRYKEMKNFLNEEAQLLTEAQVNDRLIATYKLSEPIHYKHYIVDLIELPEPKPGILYAEGFEHFEVVIDESFEQLMSDNKNITFETKGLDKSFNREISFKQPDYQVKFHQKSLEHIINIEEHPLILKVLNEIGALAPYNPCLSGTLPLGIGNENSDLDILCETKNLKDFYSEMENAFSNQKNYSIKMGDNFVLVKFEIDNLPIEVFCQNQSVFKQDANQHFLIEGRLLKILGDGLRKKIIELKDKGYETELAFGKVLNLEKPYEELKALNGLFDSELKTVFKNLSFKQL